MSVYTYCTVPQIKEWLQPLSLGRLIQAEAILNGVQNSNYHLQTTQGEWVLTLFEQTRPATIAAHLNIMCALARQGLPVPDPVHQQDGLFFRLLLGKPAALLPWITGQHDQNPSIVMLEHLGKMVARMHGVLAGLNFQVIHAKAFPWRLEAMADLLPHLNPDEHSLVSWAHHIDQNVQSVDAYLPHQMIHADLFRDNVLWHHEQITALLDFYEAGYEARIFELAVILNEWCCEPDGMLNSERARAFLNAYQIQLPLTKLELQYLEMMRVVAALRFFLSRRLASLQLVHGNILQKDPNEFIGILRCLQNTLEI